MLFILILMFCFLPPNESAKILGIFPTYFRSHQLVFSEYIKAASKIHEVTVITTYSKLFSSESNRNLKIIDIHDYGESIWNKTAIRMPFGSKNDFFSQVKSSTEALIEILEIVFKSDAIKRIVKDKFDLLVFEAFTPSTIVLAEILNIPALHMSSLAHIVGTSNGIGASQHPIYYTSAYHQKIANNFFEKIIEVYTFLLYNNYFKIQEGLENKMINKVFGSKIPPMNEIKNKIQLLFLNINTIFEGNYPAPPACIHLGALHSFPAKTLPEDLQKFLDNSKYGVIYISFGTNILPSLLPPEKISILIKVVSQLPYDVLWKWDKDEMIGKPNNVRISNWFPQNDILRHPKIKVFITQGGLQSTDEAIAAGVPLIGIPLLGDQWYNVERYVRLKIGIKLDIDTLTEDDFKNSINTIISDNKRFRHNVLKLKSVMLDQPQGSMERALWWTDYILKHRGLQHLRSPAANMHWIEYYELEFCFIVLSSLLLSLVFIGMSLFALIKYIRILTRKILMCKLLKY